MDYRLAMTGQKRDSATAGDSPSAVSSGASSENVQPGSRGSAVSGGTNDFFSSSMSFQLTSHKLNGRNYLEWAQSVKLAIDGRGKLGHLTGETTRPAGEDRNMAVWRSENSLVTAWLINSMEPAIGKPHMFLPTAKDVWEAVREMYSDSENSSQIFELKTKLWKAKQGDKNVIVFYNELETLWQELDLCYEDDW